MLPSLTVRRAGSWGDHDLTRHAEGGLKWPNTVAEALFESSSEAVSRNSCVQRIKQKSLSIFTIFCKLRENSSLARSTPVGDFSQTPVHTCVRATLRGVTCAIFIKHKHNGRAILQLATTRYLRLSGAAAALPTRTAEKRPATHTPAGARPPGGHTATHPHTHTGILKTNKEHRRARLSRRAYGVLVSHNTRKALLYFTLALLLPLPL